jgi:hypothetical protein
MWSSRCNHNWQDRDKYSGKSHSILTLPDLGLKPSRHGVNLTISRLSYVWRDSLPKVLNDFDGYECGIRHYMPIQNTNIFILYEENKYFILYYHECHITEASTPATSRMLKKSQVCSPVDFCDSRVK